VEDAQQPASLGRRLQQAREHQQLTQRELALRSNVNLDTLRAIEQGRTPNPGVLTVLRLADELETTVDALLRG
jgi:transcriptional regulator with XRE-family HTH domain